ncbi:hypothetical protein BH11MYX1_BH11MYX1_39540 [soil metagenome]
MSPFVVMSSLLVAVAACGRVGFDPATSASDAASIRQVCGAKSTAPDPLTIKSYAFGYLDFMNTRAPASGAAIQAYDASGTLRAETTTAADGTYTLSIATGGVAPRLSVRGILAGSWQTDEFYAAPLDADLTTFATETRPFGEVPIWSGGSMASIYLILGATLDPATGTVNVTTLDCSGNPLGGVSVTLDPPAKRSVYIDGNGAAVPGALGTIAPNVLQLSTNVPPGPTRITASKPGYEFAPVEIVVQAGDYNELVEMRPLL